MESNKSLSKEITFTALLASFICVLAPLSINIATPVPVTLAVVAVFFTACIGGVKKSFIAVAIYILLGAVGLPIFSNFSGGFQKLTGVTGGFIIGYIPAVLVISSILSLQRKIYVYPLAMILGLAVLYLFGAIWFKILSGTDFKYVLKVCVLPFILVDLVKIAVVSVLAISVYPTVNKFIL